MKIIFFSLDENRKYNDELHSLLKPFLLRRVKDEVLISLFHIFYHHYYLFAVVQHLKLELASANILTYLCG